MYKPLFNTVLVEIKEDQWARARGNDDSLGGEVYREGKLVASGMLVPTADYPGILNDQGYNHLSKTIGKLIGSTVMWNEGHESGTVFEEDGKKYALLYWWDLRGIEG